MTEENIVNNISRRDILKKSFMTSATVFGLGSTVKTTAAEKDTPDFNIVNRSELSETEARAEIGRAMEETAVKNIDKAMWDESGVRRSGIFGVEFETDDPEINKTNPTVVFQGYKSHHRPSEAPEHYPSEAPGHRPSKLRGRPYQQKPKTPGNSRIRPQEGRKKPKQTSMDTAGLLITIVADTTPDAETSTRRPVMAFGRTAEEPTDNISTPESTPSQLNLKTFTGDEDGNLVTRQERVEKPAEIGGVSSDGVTTQGWRDELGMYGCTAVVTTLCEGTTGSVSRYACLEACAPFISSFWGYGGCGAACFVIVDTINKYGCGAGALYICNKMF